jgi:protein-tyrosine phosphatase
VERLLRAGFDGTVQADSAGVDALVGLPIDPHVASFLESYGADSGSFAARQVDEPMVRAADVVLTLTRAHRAQVLELVPSAVRRTFTLLEFTRVVRSLDLSDLPAGLSAGDRLRAIIARATAGRALAPRAAADGDDVPDPYGRGAAAYAHSLTRITEATAELVRVATAEKG